MRDMLLKPAHQSDDHLRMSYLIEAHLAHLRAEGQSERTAEAREGILRRLHDYLPMGLAYAATSELNAWLGQAGWSRWTRTTYAMHIRAFYRWACGPGGLFDGDPTVDMAHPRGPRCLPNPVTEDELVDALDRSCEPWCTIILFAAAAGLRASEIAGVDRADVTQQEIRIVSKGGDDGMVECHPAIWDHIRDRPPGPLILHDGQPVSGRWISANARHHFDSIGMPKVHMHRFRHYFATALLDQGHDLRTIQELMRHKSVTSTQIYTLVRSGKRQMAIRTLPIPTRRPSEH